MPIHSIFKDTLIIIKGAGDLASGVAYRLKRCGFPLIMTELPTPLFVRRAVAFGEAVYSGTTTVEGITARRVGTPEEAAQLATSSIIPILVDAQATVVTSLQPQVLVDAIIAKKNTGTHQSDAPFVIALGPGFTAGQDCHVVIETNRGHNLGRIIYNGQAEANTNAPGSVQGKTTSRVLRAPAAGQVSPAAKIGDAITEGQLIVTINGHQILAQFNGVLRGIIHPSVSVTPGYKIGDMDPRGNITHCFTISDKSLAIAGGVLEAILADAPPLEQSN